LHDSSDVPRSHVIHRLAVRVVSDPVVATLGESLSVLARKRKLIGLLLPLELQLITALTILLHTNGP